MHHDVMPRPRRPILTEKPYHVFGRGNYRNDVFETPGACRAFREVLEETVVMFQWELYAFAIMPNHYHLCLRTPLGNLSAGMHHLLTTFCARFNNFREEHGHVFQGRFKCKVAPKGISVRNIIDYIHLNPARAKLRTLMEAAEIGNSSLRDFVTNRRRKFISVPEAYGRFLGFDDDAAGRAAYLAELAATLRSDPDNKDFEMAWKLAEKAERAERRKAGGLRPERRKTASEVMAEQQARWEALAAKLLAELGISEGDLGRTPMRHPLKLQIARELKTAGATYRWIAGRLHTGTPGSLRIYLRASKGSGL